MDRLELNLAGNESDVLTFIRKENLLESIIEKQSFKDWKNSILDIIQYYPKGAELHFDNSSLGIFHLRLFYDFFDELDLEYAKGEIDRNSVIEYAGHCSKLNDIVSLMKPREWKEAFFDIIMCLPVGMVDSHIKWEDAILNLRTLYNLFNEIETGLLKKRINN